MRYASSIKIVDGGVTSFSSCCCSGDFCSAGIYLKIPYILSAEQFVWPKNGRNLIFENCTCGKGETKRNTGLYISMGNSSLFEEMAIEMKKSFAMKYTLKKDQWLVVGRETNGSEFDFVEMFFSRIKIMYVRSDGLGDGCEVDNPSGSLSAALNKLCAIDSPFGYGIKILHNVNPLVVSPISLGHDLGLMIEGVNCSGENNTEVVINCDGSISTVLFSCQKSLEFKYLAFQFSATKRNWNSLISAGSGSISLTISTCRFVRIGSQAKRGKISNDDGNSPLTSSLVSVTSGSVEMDTVKCTDETSFVAFSSSPFSFSGAREVSLSGMDISKVNVESGAVISINDGSDSYSKVSIEGLNVLEVKSEKGAAAGLDITLSSKESRVAIGRSSKCSFKSCSAPEGKSGAIFIDMPKATSNLQLPSANNLEIDSSNTAGSESTSLFIIAPDFDEFCKQEDAFEFANDYDDSAVGWVEGTKDADTEPEDVYEKYIKGKKDPVPHPQPQPEPVPESEYYTGKKDKSKTNSGVIIVAVIVPLIVVIAVVVFVIVILYKKRSVNKDNNEKEQEMKDS